MQSTLGGLQQLAPAQLGGSGRALQQAAVRLIQTVVSTGVDRGPDVRSALGDVLAVAHHSDVAS